MINAGVTYNSLVNSSVNTPDVYVNPQRELLDGFIPTPTIASPTMIHQNHLIGSSYAYILQGATLYTIPYSLRTDGSGSTTVLGLSVTGNINCVKNVGGSVLAYHSNFSSFAMTLGFYLLPITGDSVLGQSTVINGAVNVGGTPFISVVPGGAMSLDIIANKVCFSDPRARDTNPVIYVSEKSVNLWVSYFGESYFYNVGGVSVMSVWKSNGNDRVGGINVFNDGIDFYVKLRSLDSDIVGVTYTSSFNLTTNYKKLITSGSGLYAYVVDAYSGLNVGSTISFSTTTQYSFSGNSYAIFDGFRFERGYMSENVSYGESLTMVTYAGLSISGVSPMSVITYSNSNNNTFNFTVANTNAN